MGRDRGRGRDRVRDRVRDRGWVRDRGANVASELFGRGSPVGERIQIAGIGFSVIGVLGAKGDVGYSSPDDYVLVPLGTHQGVLFGQDFLSSVSLQVESESRWAEIQTRVEHLLRLRHRLRPDAPDDFEVRSQTEMLETMGAITSTFTALLGPVAAVSLLVGGIGIMNNHAGLGARADARDRRPHGGRRATARHPAAVPRRVGRRVGLRRVDRALARVGGRARDRALRRLGDDRPDLRLRAGDRRLGRRRAPGASVERVSPRPGRGQE